MEQLVSRRSPIAEPLPGPTPAEGIAAISAVRWLLSNSHDEGHIAATEPVVIFGDNQAVMRKLETKSRRGKFADIWDELATLMKRAEATFPHLQVRQVPSAGNKAHSLV